MVSPQTHNLSLRLLALEALARASPECVSNEEETEVAMRVIEVLRGRLTRLSGVHGYRSLLSRALTLAKREHPALADVQIGEDGILEGVAEIGKSEGAELVLVAQLLELLTTFIGESLTLQLVREAWPEAAQDAAAGEDKS